MLGIIDSLRDIDSSKITDDWSPEQITGWLLRHFQNEGSIWVSHETIYKNLFIETQGIFHKKLKTMFGIEMVENVRNAEVLKTLNLTI